MALQVENVNPEMTGREVHELRENKFDRFLLLLATVLFAVMTLLVLIQVVIRYFAFWTGFSIHWIEEVALYLLVINTFLGSTVAWRRYENITIDIVLDRLPKKIQVIVQLIRDVILFAFLMFCSYGSYQMAARMMNAPLGSLRHIKVGHLYASLAIILVTASYYLLRWVIVRISEFYLTFFTRKSIEKAGRTQ